MARLPSNGDGFNGLQLLVEQQLLVTSLLTQKPTTAVAAYQSNVFMQQLFFANVFNNQQCQYMQPQERVTANWTPTSASEPLDLSQHSAEHTHDLSTSEYDADDDDDDEEENANGVKNVAPEECHFMEMFAEADRQESRQKADDLAARKSSSRSRHRNHQVSKKTLTRVSKNSKFWGNKHISLWCTEASKQRSKDEQRHKKHRLRRKQRQDDQIQKFVEFPLSLKIQMRIYSDAIKKLELARSSLLKMRVHSPEPS
ncbi:unnamed protein product [Caenorhabditis auriculariae]|uniref:Uncharacterized protein n=1 Tax=Caenorhabditis auriculariae TaxID=2777116 RepID=A0A8S1HLP1_9PELO|nr:unnamed protein product [Caenorhabditis auriculariae]